MNRVLMKFFKLPPGLRMMLALAGFGSLAGIVFFMLPVLRTRNAKMYLIIALLVGLLIFGLIMLLRWLFGRKKSKQLGSALDSQGPTRGDIAEQEGIYREKFRAKLIDLRANGLSVYKMPWFILVGEPGCGKTASLIHSGLDFPLGKDEVPGFGGTRNYNWWFTNQAVILDTAGRIAFQEEGTTDKVEWEIFLRLLKKNRPRCPINGLVIAIPADKLLRDSAEEREQKATVLRERLRQVHQILGVRFPTFVIVTKMDLVGGFDEFFAEVKPDLQQRNQMFGWSRPDEFQIAYDPEGFPETFDAVYRRIRDWTMRYLQRKALDDELGMIVTFPEAFRKLSGPLHDYIATIFQKSPLLEPPFFRGFYFSSAVQEGAPILDIFAQSRSGTAIQERPRGQVDSKAFFIHDFYEHKVFVEQGLVFRSAKHVTLNKRMRRVVLFGSCAMAAMMLCFFVYGYFFAMKRLVFEPKEDCADAALVIEGKKEHLPTYKKLKGNLKLAAALEKHLNAYTGGFLNFIATRALFIGASPKVPEGHVRNIHSKFVLNAVLKPVLDEFARRMHAQGLGVGTQREANLRALARYAHWYGEVVGQQGLQVLTAAEVPTRVDEFGDFLAALEPRLTADLSKSARHQFERALESLASERRTFPLEVIRDHAMPEARDEEIRGVLIEGLERIRSHWMDLTRIGEDGQGLPGMQYWTEFRDRIRAMTDRYGELLAQQEPLRDAGRFGVAAAKIVALTDGLDLIMDVVRKPDIAPAQTASFAHACFELAQYLATTEVPQTEQGKIRRPADLLAELRALWAAEFEPVRKSLDIGAPKNKRTKARPVWEKLDASETELSRSCDDALDRLRESLDMGDVTDPLAYFVEQKLLSVNEFSELTKARFRRPATIRIDDKNAFGTNALLISYLESIRKLAAAAKADQAKLDDLAAWPELIRSLKADRPDEQQLGTLSKWFTGVEQASASLPRNAQIEAASGLKGRRIWSPVKLYGTAKAAYDGRQEIRVGQILEQMATKARATYENVSEMPGLAQLNSDYYKPPRPALPFDRHSYVLGQPKPARAGRTEQEQREPEDRRSGQRFGGKLPVAAPADPSDGARTFGGGKTAVARSLMVNYHTRDFLIRRLLEYLNVADALEGLAGGQEVQEELRRSAQAYVDGYFTDWFELYNNYRKLLDERTLRLLESCKAGELDWPKFHEQLTANGYDMAAELARRTSAVLTHTAFFETVNTVDIEISPEQSKGLVNLIDPRLERLRGLGKSLYYDFRRARDFSPQQGTAAEELAGRVRSAFEKYVAQLTNVSSLHDPLTPPGRMPPNLKELAEKLHGRSPLRKDFHIYEPLLALGEYGQQLLAHDLEMKAYNLFKDAVKLSESPIGKFPVIEGAALADESPALLKLNSVAVLKPKGFVSLLRAVQEFQSRYGDLYKAVTTELYGAPRAAVTLKNCEDWINFLYPNGSVKNSGPRSVTVTFRFDPDKRPQNFVKLSTYYDKLRVTLPLLSQGGPAVIRPVELRGTDWKKTGELKWSLLSEGPFEETKAEALDVTNEGRDAGFVEGATAWRFGKDRGVWALPLLLRKVGDGSASDVWRIPVIITSRNAAGRGKATEPRAIYIIVEFKPAFPGRIPPPAVPGRMPAMEKARKFLP